MSVPSIGSSSLVAIRQLLDSQSRSRSAASSAASAGKLSEADQQVVAKLKVRDRNVRAHELAHIAAGAGVVTSGASYSYQTGPDGKRYAIGGEVGIDASPARTPQDTLRKAGKIRAAALAPVDPSAQDRSIAAKAEGMATEARMEISAAATQNAVGNTEGSALSANSASSAYAVVMAGGRSSGGRVDTWA